MASDPLTRQLDHLRSEVEKRRADADFVLRWLIQTEAPENMILLQARVVQWLGWPTHGRHCPCSACAREDWTQYPGTCGMHGEHCPAEYQPYLRPRARA